MITFSAASSRSKTNICVKSTFDLESKPLCWHKYSQLRFKTSFSSFLLKLYQPSWGPVFCASTSSILTELIPSHPVILGINSVCLWTWFQAVQKPIYGHSLIVQDGQGCVLMDMILGFPNTFLWALGWLHLLMSTVLLCISIVWHKYFIEVVTFLTFTVDLIIKAFTFIVLEIWKTRQYFVYSEKQE